MFTKLSTFAILLTIFTSIPHNSFQSTSIEEHSTVFGTCVYSYNPQNIYACELQNAIIQNPTDVLIITGSHLSGHTDADVRRVTHRNSRIAFFNGEILRKFLNLQRIEILDQGLRQYGPNAFDVCPNLQELLTGIDDQLTTFPPQMLQNCHNLQSFEVVLHSLTSIPTDLFGATTSLVSFNVANNQLSTIPDNLLQNMPNLRSFNIANNLISHLNSNLLRSAANLEAFLASGNRFTNPQTIVNILNGKHNLRRLVLLNNEFANFDFTFLSQFTSLTEFTIGSTSGPQLTQISWQSLPSSLTTLRVEGIGETLPGTAFDQMSQLTSLTLSGSGIIALSSRTFNALSRLEFLTITNTNIRNLHPDLFASQANLVNLILNNNQIQALEAGIFSPLVNIGSGFMLNGIRMVGNNIQRINVNAFGQHPQLRYIDFMNNRINEIERGVFSRFHSSIDYANFRQNVCINRTFFNGVNLDNDENLTMCFNNWAGITTTTTTTTTEAPDVIPTTTPGGCGCNFRKFEIFVIILMGFIGKFWY